MNNNPEPETQPAEPKHHGRPRKWPEGYKPPHRKRLQVRVSPIIKAQLAPIYQDRKGSPLLVREAEKMELTEALRLLASEPKDPDPTKRTVLDVLPSAVLLAVAAHYYIPPHILVRAAGIKIARQLEAERAKSRRTQVPAPDADDF